ncbi:hypothetical protein DE146DRAFT_680299 [Phaeosphaeria sp. MPI-PUGE-AT-0046c]|nr:hypothetical protein DE146DRAFT_680299 [Phaeosphaeria sp. MPI-PUGE-AT-0046c]
MVSGSVTVPAGEAAAPLNFIYACSICCYTLADVYEGHNETVEGLSDGINSKDRLVTHLYLASCCHVFCGSHLEGGAPQFHPEGQRPRAPCPTCVKEKNDSEPRDLFSIRGFQKNEYDPIIPPAWFIAPPINFEDNGKDMEALRFQYLALVRYCQSTHATRKPLQDKLVNAQKQLASQQDIVSQERSKTHAMQQETEKLKCVERKYDGMKAELERLQNVDHEVEQYRRLNINPKDLETFKNNKAAIRYYLGLMPKLVEQNIKMKKRLASLGFAMALEPIPNLREVDLDVMDDDGGINVDHYGTSRTAVRNIRSSHTVGRSAHNPFTGPSSPFGQRPLKRQRVDSPLPNNMQSEQPSSRDAMPPPQKPLSRMRSVRKIFPTLRKKFSSGRSTETSGQDPSREEDVHMYESGHWRDKLQVSGTGNHASMRQDDYASGSHCTSGALPVVGSSQSPRQRGPKMLSSVGVENDGAGFTFRAPSPVKLNNKFSELQPVRLPTEPSYIRLMDGLSRDTGFELGLKDPRENAPSTYHSTEEHRQVMRNGQDFREYEEPGQREDWCRGLPFQHHSTRGPASTNGNRLEPQRELRTNYHHDRTYQNATQDLKTPASRRYPQSGQQIESVVSPYVEGICHNTPQFFNRRIAEPQHSSNRSTDSRFRRFPKVEPTTYWSEPKGLNSLSFFDSPVIPDSTAQQGNQERRQYNIAPPSQYYQGRNLNSSGFITRPEAECSQFFRDSVYRSSTDRSTQFDYQSTPFNSAIAIPSFHRSQYSRTGCIPSDKPSIMSSRPTMCTQPQWKALHQMGVRSSQQNFRGGTQNGFSSSARDIVSSAGRRNVRR